MSDPKPDPLASMKLPSPTKVSQEKGQKAPQGKPDAKGQKSLQGKPEPARAPMPPVILPPSAQYRVLKGFRAWMGGQVHHFHEGQIISTEGWFPRTINELLADGHPLEPVGLGSTATEKAPSGPPPLPRPLPAAPTEDPASEPAPHHEEGLPGAGG